MREQKYNLFCCLQTPFWFLFLCFSD